MTSIRTRPRVLGSNDLETLRVLVSLDPLVNCVVDGQITQATGLSQREVGGTVWGLDDPASGRLRAAVFSGGNLIPVGRDAEALAEIAGEVRRFRRACSSVVGPADSIAAMWPVLARSWGRARSIRHRQPVLSADRLPHSIGVDPRVRPIRPVEIGPYEDAAVHMFAEELGVMPSTVDGGAGYRRRLLDLIDNGRAFARFDSRGRIEFKAEIGALSASTAQVQGVWVRPDLRRLGIATEAMVSVMSFALELAPWVSLYVNDYNHPARKLYDRVGFRQVDLFSTVLF
jgi:predicted GNAT family acetyltransferase